MATQRPSKESLKHDMCSVCQKEAGICNCAGCKAFFCTKDFMNHRQWLSGEFEKVIEDRNQFQEQMSDRKKIKEFQSILLSQIDQWQNTTIEKVRDAAERTRHQVIQLLNDKIKDVENELVNVTKQLRELQEMKNFVEDDLDNLKDKIHKLEKQLGQITELPSDIIHKEHSEEIDWTFAIYADDKCAHDIKVNVSCHFADAKCLWVGPRDQLNNHLIACSSESHETKLRKFYDTNEQLNKKTRLQKSCIDQHQLEIRRLKQQLEQRDQLEEQFNKQKTQIDGNESKIRLIRNRLKQRNIQLNKNNDTILLLEKQLFQRSVPVDVNEAQINGLKEQIKQQKIRIDIEETELQHTREQLKQRQYQININETQISQLKEETKRQKTQIDADKCEIRQITDQLKQREIQISTNEKAIRSVKEQLSQKNAQIDENEIVMNNLKEEKRWQNIEVGTCKSQIRQITEQANEWENKTKSKTVENQQLSTQLEEHKTQIHSIRTQLSEKEDREWYYRLALKILASILCIILLFK